MGCTFERLRDMGADAPSLCMIVSGAGVGLMQRAWRWPGISSVLAGAYTPYSPKQTDQLIGFTPDRSVRGTPSYVSVSTAIDMSMAAYARACVEGRRAIGLGMTCSVASSVEHRGDHRIIGAVFTDDGCTTAEMTIPKGVGFDQRTRDGRLADDLGEALVDAGAFGGDVIGFRPDPSRTEDFYAGCLLTVNDAAELSKERLFKRPMFRADGTRHTTALLAASDTLFFPGAFNPPHDGHFGAGAAALRTLARSMHEHRTLVFSTTVDPLHKPALTTSQVLRRASMMRGHDFLATRGDPLFIDKARAFPGASFVVGADALDRMLDPKWGIPTWDLLREFHVLGTRFLVPGRVIGGKYMTLSDVLQKRSYSVSGWSTLFKPVDYRLDISSTEIRNETDRTKQGRAA